MFNRIFVLTLGAAAMAIALTAAPSHAWERMSHVEYLTFSGAVALPGTVLPAGTYRFEAGPNGTDHSIIRVTTCDRRPYFMGVTVPIARPVGTYRTMVTFGEAPAGRPVPIKAWYPSSFSVGYQFIP